MILFRKASKYVYENFFSALYFLKFRICPLNDVRFLVGDCLDVAVILPEKGSKEPENPASDDKPKDEVFSEMKDEEKPDKVEESALDGILNEKKTLDGLLDEAPTDNKEEASELNDIMNE